MRPSWELRRASATAANDDDAAPPRSVRITHWLTTVAFLALLVSGVGGQRAAIATARIVARRFETAVITRVLTVRAAGQ